MTTAEVTPTAEETAKPIIDGMFAFIDAEVVPLEQKYADILKNERKLFKENGWLVDEIADARRTVRMKSAEAGFYAMLGPESIGGGGVGFEVACYVLEAVYRRYGPGRLLIGWSNGFLSMTTLASFVDGPTHMFLSAGDAIREEVVPGLLTGEKTVCFALTEPDAGSDFWGIKTKARRDGDEWVLNGGKQWITNAPYADYAAVLAVTNPELVEKHQGGITCFLVDASTPGYSVESVLAVAGHLASDTGIIALDDVRVPNNRIMGTLDQGFQVGMFGISEGRLCIASICLGMAEYALDRSLAYAKERHTFGVPIAEHQAIQFMLADSAIDIFSAKQTVLRAAHLVDEALKGGRLPVKEISIAKAYSVEAAERVLDHAIQIHGGMGLSNELPLEEAARIARTCRIPDGTAEIQRRTIARQLLRGDTVF
jgi:acyl-CoA dehydrogenase